MQDDGYNHVGDEYNSDDQVGEEEQYNRAVLPNEEITDALGDMKESLVISNEKYDSSKFDLGNNGTQKTNIDQHCIEELSEKVNALLSDDDEEKIKESAVISNKQKVNSPFQQSDFLNEFLSKADGGDNGVEINQKKLDDPVYMLKIKQKTEEMKQLQRKQTIQREDMRERLEKEIRNDNVQNIFEKNQLVQEDRQMIQNIDEQRQAEIVKLLDGYEQAVEEMQIEARKSINGNILNEDEEIKEYMMKLKNGIKEMDVERISLEQRQKILGNGLDLFKLRNWFLDYMKFDNIEALKDYFNNYMISIQGQLQFKEEDSQDDNKLSQDNDKLKLIYEFIEYMEISIDQKNVNQNLNKENVLLHNPYKKMRIILQLISNFDSLINMSLENSFDEKKDLDLFGELYDYDQGFRSNMQKLYLNTVLEGQVDQENLVNNMGYNKLLGYFICNDKSNHVLQSLINYLLKVGKQEILPFDILSFYFASLNEEVQGDEAIKEIIKDINDLTQPENENELENDNIDIVFVKIIEYLELIKVGNQGELSKLNKSLNTLKEDSEKQRLQLKQINQKRTSLDQGLNHGIQLNTKQNFITDEYIQQLQVLFDKCFQRGKEIYKQFEVKKVVVLVTQFNLDLQTSHKLYGKLKENINDLCVQEKGLNSEVEKLLQERQLFGQWKEYQVLLEGLVSGENQFKGEIKNSIGGCIIDICKLPFVALSQFKVKNHLQGSVPTDKFNSSSIQGLVKGDIKELQKFMDIMVEVYDEYNKNYSALKEKMKQYNIAYNEMINLKNMYLDNDEKLTLRYKKYQKIVQDFKVVLVDGKKEEMKKGEDNIGLDFDEAEIGKKIDQELQGVISEFIVKESLGDKATIQLNSMQGLDINIDGQVEQYDIDNIGVKEIILGSKDKLIEFKEQLSKYQNYVLAKKEENKKIIDEYLYEKKVLEKLYDRHKKVFFEYLNQDSNLQIVQGVFEQKMKELGGRKIWIVDKHNLYEHVQEGLVLDEENDKIVKEVNDKNNEGVMEENMEGVMNEDIQRDIQGNMLKDKRVLIRDYQLDEKILPEYPSIQCEIFKLDLDGQQYEGEIKEADIVEKYQMFIDIVEHTRAALQNDEKSEWSENRFASGSVYSEYNFESLNHSINLSSISLDKDNKKDVKQGIKKLDQIFEQKIKEQKKLGIDKLKENNKLIQKKEEQQRKEARDKIFDLLAQTVGQNKKQELNGLREFVVQYKKNNLLNKVFGKLVEKSEDKQRFVVEKLNKNKADSIRDEQKMLQEIGNEYYNDLVDWSVEQEKKEVIKQGVKKLDQIFKQKIKEQKKLGIDKLKENNKLIQKKEEQQRKEARDKIFDLLAQTVGQNKKQELNGLREFVVQYKKNNLLNKVFGNANESLEKTQDIVFTGLQENKVDSIRDEQKMLQEIGNEYYNDLVDWSVEQEKKEELLHKVFGKLVEKSQDDQKLVLKGLKENKEDRIREEEKILKEIEKVLASSKQVRIQAQKVLRGVVLKKIVSQLEYKNNKNDIYDQKLVLKGLKENNKLIQKKEELLHKVFGKLVEKSQGEQQLVLKGLKENKEDRIREEEKILKEIEKVLASSKQVRIQAQKVLRDVVLKKIVSQLEYKNNKNDIYDQKLVLKGLKENNKLIQKKEELLHKVFGKLVEKSQDKQQLVLKGLKENKDVKQFIDDIFKDVVDVKEKKEVVKQGVKKLDQIFKQKIKEQKNLGIDKLKENNKLIQKKEEQQRKEAQEREKKKRKLLEKICDKIRQKEWIALKELHEGKNRKLKDQNVKSQTFNKRKDNKKIDDTHAYNEALDQVKEKYNRELQFKNMRKQKTNQFLDPIQNNILYSLVNTGENQKINELEMQMQQGKVIVDGDDIHIPKEFEQEVVVRQQLKGGAVQSSNMVEVENKLIVNETEDTEIGQDGKERYILAIDPKELGLDNNFLQAMDFMVFVQVAVILDMFNIEKGNIYKLQEDYQSIAKIIEPLIEGRDGSESVKPEVGRRSGDKVFTNSEDLDFDAQVQSLLDFKKQQEDLQNIGKSNLKLSQVRPEFSINYNREFDYNFINIVASSKIRLSGYGWRADQRFREEVLQKLQNRGMVMIS